MKILVLNGSPRRNGTVASVLKSVTESLSTRHDIEWIHVCKLKMKYCTACMAYREKEKSILPEDDAHIVGKKIQDVADVTYGACVAVYSSGFFSPVYGHAGWIPGYVSSLWD